MTIDKMSGKKKKWKRDYKRMSRELLEEADIRDDHGPKEKEKVRERERKREIHYLVYTPG